MARHGLIALGTALFLRVAKITSPEGRLGSVISTQAAASIVAFGQISRAPKESGYNTDLAFDIVSLSFPLTVLLNTAAGLCGQGYVDALPLVGAGMLAVSAGLYYANKKDIDGLQ